MAGRYDRINGAYCKVKKRYVRIGGAWTPVKKRFDKVNGVWAPSYSGAITWTYTKSGDSYSDSNVLCKKVVDSNHSMYLELDAYSSGDHNQHSDTLTVKYTFSEPLKMKAGQTLKSESNARAGQYGYEIYFDNDTEASISGGWHNELGIYFYTFPTDRQLSSITIRGLTGIVSQDGYEYAETGVLLTINSSDYGSFLLNNSGSSDQ